MQDSPRQMLFVAFTGTNLNICKALRGRQVRGGEGTGLQQTFLKLGPKGFNKRVDHKVHILTTVQDPLAETPELKAPAVVPIPQ